MTGDIYIKFVTYRTHIVFRNYSFHLIQYVSGVLCQSNLFQNAIQCGTIAFHQSQSWPAQKDAYFTGLWQSMDFATPTEMQSYEPFKKIGSFENP